VEPVSTHLYFGGQFELIFRVPHHEFVQVNVNTSESIDDLYWTKPSVPDMNPTDCEPNSTVVLGRILSIVIRIVSEKFKECFLFFC
jgi:hypothetical protein